MFFKHLQGGEVEITAGYPAGVIGTTKDNLEAAAAGEKMEWTTLYANFAKTAKAEGFPRRPVPTSRSPGWRNSMRRAIGS